MTTLTEETWAGVQRGCDECPVCRRDSALETGGQVPARPWWPERQGRFLLISEAPPLTGGFWQTGEYDGLREHLFCVLQGLGRRFPNDLHGDEAIRTFMAGDLFLLQTVKWPLAKGSRKRRPSFNHLGPGTRDALLAHTAASHLGPELRGQRYEMKVEERPIALDVTSLPVDQNMRRPAAAADIREEIAEFLRHHRSRRTDTRALGLGTSR